jgi:hypothetical protein
LSKVMASRELCQGFWLHSYKLTIVVADAFLRHRGQVG